MSKNKPKEKEQTETGLISKNRQAYFNYEILEEFEAGIVLTGSEVKSLRLNGCQIVDAYADLRSEGETTEVFLTNLNIPVYQHARHTNHKPSRDRKLLLHKREIKKFIGRIKQKGLTLVALSLYFNKKGVAKVRLGLGRGKTSSDKRETIKEREWNRNKQRMLKE
jgi:SsrA-binding protein